MPLILKSWPVFVYAIIISVESIVIEFLTNFLHLPPVLLSAISITLGGLLLLLVKYFIIDNKRMTKQKASYSLVRYELYTELLRLRSSLNESFSIARSIALDPKHKVEERLQALDCKDTSRLNIIKLICEGPEFISNMQVQQQPKYHKSQSKIMMQAQPHP